MTNTDTVQTNKSLHISITESFDMPLLSSHSGQLYPVPISSHTLLLDHRSIIQNPLVQEFEREFGNLETTEFVEAEFISRERDRKEIQRLLDNGAAPNQLAFYDQHKGPKAIVDKFLDYMEKTAKDRKFLAAKIDLKNGTRNIFWEALNRYQSNRNIRPVSELLEILTQFNVPSIMLTLTYDPAHRSQRESWELVSKDFNRFLTRLKIEIAKERGIKVSELQLPYIRVLEAQHDPNGNNYGYAHIHVLFFGMDYLYWNGNHKEYEFIKSGHPIRKSIESFWKLGYTSVNKTASGQNIRNPVNYLMKYIRKTWGSWNDEALLTKAMLWAFNKRTFDVSRKFGDFVKTTVEGSGIEIEMNRRTSTPIQSLLNPSNKVSISVSESGASIICGNDTVEIGLDDFQLAAEGTVTPALKEIGERLQIQEQEILMCATGVPPLDDKTRDLLRRVKQLTTKAPSAATLLGMIKAFRPHRKSSPQTRRKTRVVWVETKQVPSTPPYDEQESYTVDDLDFLAEQSAYFRSTREQERALKFLMAAYNSGHTDWVYYSSPPSDPPEPQLKKYRKGKSLMRQGNET